MLHLLDDPADFQTAALAAAVAGDRAVRVRSLAIFRRLSGPVHAWGNRSLAAAALAGCRPIVYTPPIEMTAAAWRWTVWIARRRDVTVICPTDALRNALARRGVAPDRCRVIRPGAIAAGASAIAFADSDFVILAPGESTRAADHALAIWAAAIAQETDPTWKVLLWGRGPLAAQLIRLDQRLTGGRLVHTAPDCEFSQIIRAADLALVTERTGPSLATAMCMAAGLPVIHAAGDRSVSHLTRKLLEVRTNSQRRATLAAQAKAKALALFSMERFVAGHQAIYDELPRSGNSHVKVLDLKRMLFNELPPPLDVLPHQHAE